MLLQLYDVPQGEPTDRIKAVAEAARQRSQHRVAPWLRAYVGYEAEAAEIKVFNIDLMPGLLQTADYTRAITQPHELAMDRAGVERLVAIRRERQARLLGDDPPQMHAVICEAAIRFMVGGHDVMREQLERLLELSQLPTVSLQLLPFSLGAHASMGTAFVILRLPGPSGGQVAVLEGLWSAEYVDRAPQVADYNRVFDSLSQAALDEQGTRAAIEGVIRELS